MNLFSSFFDRAIHDGFPPDATRDQEFELILDLLGEDALEYRLGLGYINNILHHSLNLAGEEDLNTLHLHLPHVPDRVQEMVLELLIIKLLFISIKERLLANEINIADLRSNQELALFDPNAQRSKCTFFRNTEQTPNHVIFSPVRCPDETLVIDLGDRTFRPLFRKEKEKENDAQNNVGEGVSGRSVRFKKAQEERNRARLAIVSNHKTFSRISAVIAEVHGLEGLREVSTPLRTLINLPKGTATDLFEGKWKYKWYGHNLLSYDNTKHSLGLDRARSMLYNSDVAFDQLVSPETPYLVNGDDFFCNSLRNIIIWDSASKKEFKGFSKNTLQNYVTQGYGHFQNLILITFDKKPSVLHPSIHSKLQEINSTYFQISKENFKNNRSILFMDPEAELLGSCSNNINIEFDRLESIDKLFETIKEIIADLGQDQLFYLTSIRLRNIISMAFNQRCKTIILDLLFGESTLLFEEETTLISILQAEEIKLLKGCFERILDAVIQSGRIQNALEACNEMTGVIIPEDYLKEPRLYYEVQYLAKKNKALRFYSWRNTESVTESELLILDYRDTGSHPFVIYPNIITFSSEKKFTTIKGRFIHQFFHKNYQFTTNSYGHYVYQRYIGSGIRKEIYANLRQDDWKYSENKLSPPVDLDIAVYDVDNRFQRYDKEQISIRTSEGTRLFGPRELFLFTSDLVNEHIVVKTANELLSTEPGAYIQQLSELFKDLNIFDLTEKEIKELKEFKEHYGYGETSDSEELWKLMLNEKAKELGRNELYKQLSTACHKYGTTMVSREWFENNWLHKGTTSVAPSYKGRVLAICNACGLPQQYARLILKKRAQLIQNSRESNGRMSALIRSLIERGLFHDVSANYDLWELECSRYFELADFGINVNNIRSEIIALISLLKDNIDLKPLKEIKPYDKTETRLPGTIHL
jgi:hypothetical protein